jgi:hypothetical protein
MGNRPSIIEVVPAILWVGVMYLVGFIVAGACLVGVGIFILAFLRDPLPYFIGLIKLAVVVAILWGLWRFLGRS